MDKVIFSMIRVGKLYPPNRWVLKNISLSFFYGAKIGVIGLNGAGKSTLLKIIAGLEEPTEGKVVYSPGYSIGYFPQEPELDANKTVREVVEEGVAPLIQALKEYEEISMRFAEPMSDEELNKLIDRQSELTNFIETNQGWELDRTLQMAMEALMCPSQDRLIGTLSGGEKRRVALVRLLLQQPDILLLDEPTNHLDANAVYWLEQFLRDYPGTIIAVTHDRYFLDHVAEWILELDRGEGVPWKGNYTSWLQQKLQMYVTDQKIEERKIKTLQYELEWAQLNAQQKIERNRSRLKSYERLYEEETSKKEKNYEIFIPKGPRLGNDVIRFEHVSVKRGERWLINDLSFTIPPTAVVGIIGPNGAGKTTLLRLIAGYEQPTEGRVVLGSTVQISYIDQQHSPIDPDKTVYELVSDGRETINLDQYEIPVRAYLARFQFTGPVQEKKCGLLSGGERNRLHLALALKKPSNVLLLDEPTNDIDINTLRALELAIEHFAGCTLIVSHDRWFLQKLCTHLIIFEPEGNVRFFEGTLQEYENQYVSTVGKKRIPFRKIYQN
ncbi:MAG: energy-dependent translational throttle protein EttA [Bacteroidales bacterium]|nr:energy-dependent translational throttle protein EttA [Bacteroidales bacterium]